MERMTGVALGSGGQLREMQGATPAHTLSHQLDGHISVLVELYNSVVGLHDRLQSTVSQLSGAGAPSTINQGTSENPLADLPIGGQLPIVARLGQQNGNLNRVISMLSARLDAIGDEIARLNMSL